MLTAQGIVKQRGRRRVLDGLDLDLASGSCTVVTGTNGCGKSTLLRIVAGLTRVDAGQMRGRPRRVGYLPERFRPPGSLDAASYLWHMGRLKGMAATDIRLRSEFLANAFALAPGLGVDLETLSKGNLQKVGVIQAFLAPETLVVLDEPRTGLDEQSSRTLDELISQTCAQGAAVLVSDHQPVVGTRMCRLHDGVLQWPSTVVDDLTTLITLRRRDGAISHRQPRIDAAHRISAIDGAAVAVHVAPADCDRALVCVIEQGWSVFEVRNVRAGIVC